MPGEPGGRCPFPSGRSVGGAASGAPPPSGGGGARGGTAEFPLRSDGAGRGGAEGRTAGGDWLPAPANGRAALRPSNKPDLALALAARQPRPPARAARGGTCAARSAPWRPGGLRALRPTPAAEPWDKRGVAGTALLGTLHLPEVAPGALVSVGGGGGTRRRRVVVDVTLLCLCSS